MLDASRVEWTLPPLPYGKRDLEPYIGAETVEYHYEKHHQGYLDTLRAEIDGTLLAKSSLEELVVHTRGKLFNPAAQVWNHNFYWRSMSPDGGGSPPAAVQRALERAFGSVDAFRSTFVRVAAEQFGSGWAWLYRHRDDGRLVVASTEDAETPLALGHVPLLTVDVWEHAYYLDYRHERQRYLETFVEHLVDWEFVRRNLERPMEARAEQPAN